MVPSKIVYRVYRVYSFWWVLVWGKGRLARPPADSPSHNFHGPQPSPQQHHPAQGALRADRHTGAADGGGTWVTAQIVGAGTQHLSSWVTLKRTERILGGQKSKEIGTSTKNPIFAALLLVVCKVLRIFHALTTKPRWSDWRCCSAKGSAKKRGDLLRSPRRNLPRNGSGASSASCCENTCPPWLPSRPGIFAPNLWHWGSSPNGPHRHH